MKVVALFRVSTEKQATEGASLDSQQGTYRQHALAKGWTTIAEFRGHESATQAASDRRVLQQVLACVRDRQVDAIYVHEQSRLTRGDELEVAMLMRELRERGLKVIVNGMVRDLHSIDERFMFSIQSLVDRTESERIKERMTRGKRERGRQGKKTGGPAPYGYVNPPPGHPDRGKLQVVPEEAVVVRRLFDLATKGGNPRSIAARLNEAGTPGPRGGKWSKSSVRRMLDCEAYIGTAAAGVWVAEPGSRTFRKVVSERSQIVENAHAPIVDRETWDAVHSRPRQPRTAKPRMLTGLLYWDGTQLCGDSCDGISYYRAPRGSRGGPWLDAADVDATVWGAFTSLATGEDFVAKLLAEAERAHDRTVVEHEVAYLVQQSAKLERRLDTLTSMRADGEITKEQFADRKRTAEAELDGLRKRLNEERGKLAAYDRSHIQRVVGAVRVLLGGRTRLTEAQKREILTSIVRRVDITVERIARDFNRDERGRVTAGRAARWRAAGVHLTLATGVTEPPATGDLRAVPDEIRPGQLVTTPWVCDQVAGTESRGDTESRPGQLVPTLSCSAPRAPASR